MGFLIPQTPDRWDVVFTERLHRAIALSLALLAMTRPKDPSHDGDGAIGGITT